MNEGSRAVNIIVGLGAVGPAIVGITAYIAALFAFASADFTGAGALLIAAALAFGLLAHAVLSPE